MLLAWPLHLEVANLPFKSTEVGKPRTTDSSLPARPTSRLNKTKILSLGELLLEAESTRREELARILQVAMAREVNLLVLVVERSEFVAVEEVEVALLVSLMVKGRPDDLAEVGLGVRQEPKEEEVGVKWTV
jgi:hypothetical protein